MRLASRLILTMLLGSGTVVLAACSADPSCAEGTVLQGDKCVGAVSGCGGGTVLDPVSGGCVSACPATEYWDGTACQTVPTCGPGTTLGAEGCVPDCADGFRWSENACVADCAAGTVLDPLTSTCVLDPTGCGPGSHFEDGRCIADVECGPGTHAEGGVCVAGLPEPDITESPDPEIPASFDVPAPGEEVILGGTLTTDDTARDLPGDRFVMTGSQGNWLRLTATGTGGLRPALRIVSTDPQLAGGPIYERMLYESGALQVSRELYLPTTGTYEILVTTQDELLAFVFDGGSLPVGGPDLQYSVAVRNLGTPTPIPVAALPTASTGELDDGALGFYLLTAPDTGGIVAVSSGAAVLPDEPGDFFPAALAFDGAGEFLRGRVSFDTYEQAEFLVERPANASTLVVQDFFLALGPRRDYRLALTEVTPTLCATNPCDTTDLPAGGEALLRWELEPGDLFMAGGYAPSATGYVRGSLHDGSLEGTGQEHWFGGSAVGAERYYAEAATTVSLWLREYMRQPTDDVSIIAQTEPTHLLANDQQYASLGLVQSPPYTFGRFGIDHVVAQAGDLLFFPGFATYDGSGEWLLPKEALLTASFETVGPILDPSSDFFPDYGLTPLIGYARESRHYLHLVWDDYGDPVGGTYDVGFSTLATADLGAPTPGNDVMLSSQVLNGLKAYRFTGERDQSLTITVTPSIISSGFRPEVWVMNFGRAEFDMFWYRWAPDPEVPQLGVAAHESATGGGESVTISYPSPYDGLTVLMVENASTSSVNIFSIQVSAN